MRLAALEVAIDLYLWQLILQKDWSIEIGGSGYNTATCIEMLVAICSRQKPGQKATVIKGWGLFAHRHTGDEFCAAINKGLEPQYILYCDGGLD